MQLGKQEQHTHEQVHYVQNLSSEQVNNIEHEDK